ncbi:hypothetical protein E2C06_17830 [Dankookia rubra]|uniref:Uncharacterized protein n=1 Tax=Dankookia rubra TaxID=1442381 RepID=A0A4R5QFC4_9PROT|nr:DNA-binding protein [Dankookia rubra]TDH61231.1 hypothetical protein E2C06_17830 [Dankookia rubra]
MAKAQVSDDRIIEEGRRIAEAGRKVHGWSLRAAIGTGRPDRLESVWTRWLETQGEGKVPENPEETGHTSIPSRISEALTETKRTMEAHLDGLVLSLVRVTTETYDGRYRDEFADLQRKRAEADEQLSAASSAVADADNKAEALEKERDQLVSDLAQVRESLAVLQANLSRTESERDKASTERDELAGRIDGERDAAQAAKGALAEARAHSAAMSNELRTARENLTAAAKLESDLRNEIADYEKQAVDLHARLTSASARASEAETQRTAQSQRAEAAEAATVRLEASIGTLTSRADKAEASLEELSTKLAAMTRRAERAEGAQDAAEKAMEALRGLIPQAAPMPALRKRTAKSESGNGAT